MINSCNDYESLGRISFINREVELLEAYTGTSIVRWHGKIEAQLVSFLTDSEKSRNYTYSDKLRAFLKIWRENEITGSINREVLDTLKAAADMLSVDTWSMASYFRSLRDELRVLIASEEQLPRGADANANDPMAGSSGGPGGAPPMSPDFGAEAEAPAGAGAEPTEGAGEPDIASTAPTPPEEPGGDETEEDEEPEEGIL